MAFVCARETNKMTAAKEGEKNIHEPLKVWNCLENLITNNLRLKHEQKKAACNSKSEYINGSIGSGAHVESTV